MRINTDGVLLGAWANVQDGLKVLDVGTGTGIIALMVAQRNKKAWIEGIDIDDQAALISERNFNQSRWKDRLSQVCGSFPTAIHEEVKYDYIISNPPFFTNSTLSKDHHQKTARHTTELTQYQLAKGVARCLAEEGKFGLILPVKESEEFQEVAKACELFCNRKTQVRPNPLKKIERVLMEFSMKKEVIEVYELIIRNSEPNNYTVAYKSLTKDFYLNF